MLEIGLMAILAIMMARRGYGRGRKFRKYLRGNVDEKMDIGTLAARTLVAQVFGETVQERTYISSLVAAWALDDVTVAADDGPLMVGVAHSDYSAAEIEEFIETTGSWNEADLVQAREVAKRFIRVVGIFRSAPGGLLGSATLNEGRPIKTKLGWILTTGQSLDLWAYNLGASAYATTTPSLVCQGHANLWPT